MSNAGGNCIRWLDRQGRDCKSNGRMRFHVVADEDFRSAMHVPQEFGSYLRKINSDTIKLNAPNGCTYDIGVSREMGQIVLRSGWNVFATAHNVEKNDSLVFKFCGSSSFKIQIYSSCGGSRNITSCGNPDREILEDIPPRTTSDRHVPNGNVIPHPGPVQTTACFEYFTSGGSRLTKAQDKKVLEIARTIKSEIPLYVAVMNKSNVDLNGCSMRIPSLLREDVKEEVFQTTVELEDPDAYVYSVSATQQGHDEIVLQSGWDTFVVAHHVQERDVIIFRHKGNSLLEVFILDRNGHKKTSSGFGMVDVSNSQEMCDGSVKFVDPPHKAVDIIDQSSSSDDENNVATYSAKSAICQTQQLHHCVKARMMASTSCPSIKSGRLLITEGPSWPPYIISSRVSLSRVLEKMVLGKVQAIRSEIPIHVSVMTKSNIGERAFLMYFAKDYARYLPSTTQDLILQLEGCQSKKWHTVLHVQGGYSRACGMCRIASGWAEFVSDNHLWLGDICLFELVRTTRRLRMNVYLIRKSQYRSAYVQL